MKQDEKVFLEVLIAGLPTHGVTATLGCACLPPACLLSCKAVTMEGVGLTLGRPASHYELTWNLEGAVMSHSLLSPPEMKGTPALG